MNTSSFKAALERHPDKFVRFVLPEGDAIPATFHVTEVGHVVKNFIDCGGTVRRQESCLLQAWVAENDPEHRLTAGKLAGILTKARRILPTGDLPVEVEFERDVVAQYVVGEPAVAGAELQFPLGNKQTDCLARETCGVEPAGAGCGCGDGSGKCC